MTWALCSTMEDMVAIESGFKETGLSGQDRNKMRAYWAGGLKDWRTSACIPTDHPCFATDGVMSRDPQVVSVDPETGVATNDTPTCMRVVPCTFGTLADFQDLLQALIDKNPDAAYYEWLEPFITTTGWYGVDPYPPSPGYFAGMVCS